MKNNFLFFALFMFFSASYGQSVGINTDTPHSSAILDVKTNGTHRSWTLPKIHLSTSSDKTGIVDEDPADALLIYNTNENLPAGKGIYYWDSTNGRWQFMVSQMTIELFRDLTRYYTKDSQTPTAISTTPVGATQYNIDSNTTNWTMIKDENGNTMELAITVDHPDNFLDINLSGTWLAYRNANNVSVARSYEVAYGIFVDGQLKYVKIDTLDAPNSCTLSNFYVNSIIPNISTAAEKITFGVQLRRVRGSGAGVTTFPTNTTLQIGGTATGGTTGCKNANAFENITKATVYINQTL